MFRSAVRFLPLLMVLSLLLQLAPPAQAGSNTATIGASINTLSRTNDRWMGDLSTRGLGSKTIADVVIPGTHDSATYGLNVLTGIRFDPADMQSGWQATLNVLGYLVTAIKPIIYAYGRTQSRNFSQQLNDGIRYFDLRLSYEHLDNKWYTYHGLLGPSLDDLLNQVSDFLNQSGHEQEIVILSFGRTMDTEGTNQLPSDTQKQALRQKIHDKFGGWIAPVSEQNNTLKQLWSNNRRIIMKADFDGGSADYWPGSSFTGEWPNKQKTSDLLDHMKTKLSAGASPSSNKFVLSTELTADGDMRAQAYTGVSCIFIKCYFSAEDLANEATDAAIDKIFEWWVKNENNARTNLNIITTDFYEKSDLVKMAKVMNAPVGIDSQLTGFAALKGQPVSVSGTYTGWKDGENVEISTFSLGKVTKTGTSSGTWTYTVAPPFAFDSTVTIRATDARGMRAEVSFELTFSEPPPFDSVVLYDDKLYGTPSKTFPIGEYPTTGFNVLSLPSSIKVGGGVTAVLHSCEDFGGPGHFNGSWRVFTEDDPDLGDGIIWPDGHCGTSSSLDNSVKALWVMPKSCTPHFHQVAVAWGISSGSQIACFYLDPGEYPNPESAHAPNDFGGYVLVGGGVRFKGYTAINYGGTEVVREFGAPLGDLSDTLSSFKVEYNDNSAPITNYGFSGPLPSSGWHNAPIDVSLTGSDDSSGIAHTYYTLNGGSPTEYTGPFTMSTNGATQLGYWSVDKAGNTESPAKQRTIQVDAVPPVTTPSFTGTAGSNNWYRSNVTVSLSAVDTLSGLDTPPGTFCSPDDGPTFFCPNGTSPLVFNTSGRHTLKFYTQDRAANTETPKTVTIDIDKDAPTTTHSFNTSPFANGSYPAGTLMSFAATDALSGVATTTITAKLNSLATASATSPIVLRSPGHYAVTYFSTDSAGNNEAVHSLEFDVENPAPVLQTISPMTITAGNAADAEFTATGSGFILGTKVLVNGTQVPSGLSSQTELSFAVPADMVSSAQSLSSLIVTLSNPGPGGGTSAPLALTVIDTTITEANSGVAPTGGSASASTAPSQAGSAGVSATLTHAGSGNAVVTAANYTGVPGGAGALGVGTSYLDLKVTGAGAGDSLAAKVYYPSTITGVDETSLALKYWDGAVWKPVLGTGGATPSKDTTDNLDGTVSGGRISFTLDGTSTPTLAQLTGTPLALVADSTPPTVNAVTVPATPDGANGWFISNPTVNFTAQDEADGSGVKEIAYALDGGATVTTAGGSASTTVTTEGTHAFSYLARDNAGNASASQALSVKLDKTAPAAAPAVTAGTAGANGWYTTAVTVSWNWSDGVSGLNAASCPSTSTSSGQGAITLTATCQDLAGNSGSASYAVKVDTAGPAVTVSRSPGANAAGWNNGDVTITAAGTDDGSGLDSCTTTVVSSEGANQTGSAGCADKAGNNASQSVTGINIDKTAPSATPAVTAGSAGANGWYTTDVTVSWNWADTLSGLGLPGCPATSTSAGEGALTLSATCKDLAGNSTTANFVVKVDKTLPAVTASRAPAANAAGWNNGDVTVTAAGTDGGSGLDTCDTKTVSTEGANQSATVGCSDKAGNRATQTVTGIRIDKTAPATNGTLSTPANANGWNQQPVKVTLAAVDALSGVAGTEYQLDGGAWTAYTAAVAVGEGVHTLQYRSTDKAGNQEATKSLTVKVDTKVPEAWFEFDPAAKDVKLYGRDAGGSGLPTTAIAPTTVDTKGKWDDSDDDEGAAHEKDKSAEVRTYVVADAAGNSVTIVAKVKRTDDHVKLSVATVQLGNGSPTKPEKAKAAYEWKTDKAGAVTRIDQRTEAASGSQRDDLTAAFDASKNQTVITAKSPKREPKVTKPGLVIIRLVLAGKDASSEY